MHIAPAITTGNFPSIPGGRLPCGAFLSESASAALVGRVQAARGWPVAAAEGGLGAAATVLPSMPTPALLVLDIDGAGSPTAAIEGLAEHCDPGTRVLAVGTPNEIGLFRALLEIGVEDYLPKPLDEAVLGAALDRIVAKPAKREAGPAAPKEGRVAAVVGARGGVGATGLAVNLAWALAELRERRAVLVDLDLQYGTTALAFDCEPGRGLYEALSNPERIDDLFLQRAAVKLTERLSLLCAEEGPERRLGGRQDGLGQVLEHLRSGFDDVVLDLPRGAATDLPELRAADRVLLVTDYTLAGLRDVVRLSRHVRAVRPEVTPMVVAAMAGAPGRAEVTRNDMEKALGTRIAAEIPFDAKAFVAGAQAGVPVVRHMPKSRASLALRALAAELDPGGTTSRPFWMRLLPKVR